MKSKKKTNLVEVQAKLEKQYKMLTHVGLLPKLKATKTIVDRFCKCVDWDADTEKFGYDRKEKFLSKNNYSKAWLMQHGDFVMLDPLPKLRKLKR
tara:strand:+ start:2431 stop:2715 length:285 start_codon:yes stop_codon:yes gene_type:complete